MAHDNDPVGGKVHVEFQPVRAGCEALRPAEVFRARPPVHARPRRNPRSHPERDVAPPHFRAPVQDTSDETLIGLIADGDKRAMQVLYARHNVRVYRFVLRLTGNQSLAEDLVSEVFLDVWRQAASFERRSSVSTWLLAIARYKALSARRRGGIAAASSRAGRILSFPVRRSS